MFWEPGRPRAVRPRTQTVQIMKPKLERELNYVLFLIGFYWNQAHQKMLPLLWCEKIINKDRRRHKSSSLCFDSKTTESEMCYRTLFHKGSGIIGGAKVFKSSDQSRARAHEKKSTRGIPDRFPEDYKLFSWSTELPGLRWGSWDTYFFEKWNRNN